MQLIENRIFVDERGHFLELWRHERYQDLGIVGPFVQDNASHSKRGVLRGLHFQWPNPQGKLVSVLEGEIVDVAVDLRTDSETFGRWVSANLSADNGRQLWIPEGFGHGFAVVSGTALVTYKCTDVYSPQDEQTIRWDDPGIAIDWQIDDPQVSAKDAAGMTLSDFAPDQLPSKAALARSKPS